MDPKRIVAEGYDRIHRRYDEWSSIHDDAARSRYLDLAVRLVADGARALDLGCGTGLRTAVLAERCAVVGVDLSWESLRLARQNVPGGAFVFADMAAVAFRPRSFDLVTAFYSLIHLPREEQPSVLCRVAEWLVPGGHLMATMAGGEEASGGVDDDWLGAPMYWSGWDHRRNRWLVEEAGLEVVSADLVTQMEDATPVTFLWVVARLP